MTRQRAARRLADAGDDQRAGFEISSKLAERKEERGLSSLRDDLLMRAKVDRIELLPKTGDGTATLSWSDGRVIAILNSEGPGRVIGDEQDTILGALASAINHATETGL